MDSFHRHLDELERLLSGDDKMKRRMKSRALCFAAFVGSNPVVETLIHKGVGKEYIRPIMERVMRYTVNREIFTQKNSRGNFLCC